ncbi:hypothetical protein FEM48_Zijuj01G0296700 [Ziziphus jujuba var. spinosa]|uniref:Thionin-like protein 2 n=1 Tax=Ziziphus jujuba var. spinosa TaxID=714518 RepID=A0A978W5T1_ZIZJJ|nr:hypothetical protein FEM48_Zijuj01G0296700 [Ziziphus jujuba var. spinosa]
MGNLCAMKIKLLFPAKKKEGGCVRSSFINIFSKTSMGDMKRMMIVFAVVGLLLMVPSSTSASFASCYGGCFLLCVIIPTNTASSCALQCLKNCIVPPSSTLQLSETNSNYFCKLGCASSLCSNYSTKQNPNSKKVEGCVDSCSGICTKN